jgi:type II secretory pathway component PulF
MSGLIRAAARTGHLGPALTELMDHYQSTSLLRRNIWRGLAYPLMVGSLAAVVLLFILAFVAGGFERIFQDFGAELPVLTEAVFTWRRIGFWLLPSLLLILALLAALIRWRVGPVARGRWLASMPVLGPLWHWLALVEWIGLVRVLVRNQVTLLEALRLSAGGVSNANVGQLSLSLAEGIARGRSLSQGMSSARDIPVSLVPLVRWGEEAGALADSLGMGREMLEERVRMRSLWLQMALPPILFVAIGGCVLLVVVALFLPLISLVQNLT